MIRIHYSNIGQHYFNSIKIDRYDSIKENKNEIIECILKGLENGFVVSIMDTEKVISFKDFTY